MAELALFITSRAQPGRRDELKAAWERHLRDRAASNDEQTHYVYAYDDADENVIRIAEVYTTRAAFEANAGTEWFAAFLREAMPLLDGEPEVHTTTPQWVK